MNVAEGRLNEPRAPRIHYLDGIRGWASFAVLLSHIDGAFLSLSSPQLRFDDQRLASSLAAGNYLEYLLTLFLKVMSDGYLAVMIFFVLSGYALSVAHLNPRRRNLAGAATSRYFRLMIPILATSAIAYLLLKFGLFYNLQAATSPESSSGWLGRFYRFPAQLWHMLSFSLGRVFYNYDPASTYNSSLWTMHLEILGSYLIYAYLALFRTTEKVQWRMLALAIAALLATRPMYACFFTGYMIAELTRPGAGLAPSRRYAVPCLIAFCAALASSAYTATVAARLGINNDILGCLVATTVVLAVSLSPALVQFFSNGLSRFLGRISFPLYLIQVIVICSWSSFLFIQLPRLGFGTLTANLINLGATIVASILAAVALLPVEWLSIRWSKAIAAAVLAQLTRARGARPVTW